MSIFTLLEAAKYLEQEELKSKNGFIIHSINDEKNFVDNNNAINNNNNNNGSKSKITTSPLNSFVSLTINNNCQQNDRQSDEELISSKSTQKIVTSASRNQKYSSRHYSSSFPTNHVISSRYDTTSGTRDGQNIVTLYAPTQQQKHHLLSPKSPTQKNSPVIGRVGINGGKNGMIYKSKPSSFSNNGISHMEVLNEVSPKNFHYNEIDHHNSISNSNSSNFAVIKNDYKSPYSALASPPPPHQMLAHSAPASFYGSHGNSFQNHFGGSSSARARHYSGGSETSNFDEGEPRRRTGSNATRSGTREVHNKLEKNRRAHLKECFELLKRQLPLQHEDKKTSNLSILHSAFRHIQMLKRKEREHEHEMERLAREKIAFQQKVAILKKDLSLIYDSADYNKIVNASVENEPEMVLYEYNQMDVDVESTSGRETRNTNNSGGTSSTYGDGGETPSYRNSGSPPYGGISSDEDNNVQDLSNKRDTKMVSASYLTKVVQGNEQHGIVTNTTNGGQHFVTIPASIIQSNNLPQQVLLQATPLNESSTSKLMSSSQNGTPISTLQIPLSQVVNGHGFVVSPTLQLVQDAQCFRVVQSMNGSEQLALVTTTTSASAATIAVKQQTTNRPIALVQTTATTPSSQNTHVQTIKKEIKQECDDESDKINSSITTSTAQKTNQTQKLNAAANTFALISPQQPNQSSSSAAAQQQPPITTAQQNFSNQLRAINKNLTFTSTNGISLLQPVLNKSDISYNNKLQPGQNATTTSIIVPQQQANQIAQIIGATQINGKVVTPLMKTVNQMSNVLSTQYITSNGSVKSVKMATSGAASLPPPTSGK